MRLNARITPFLLIAGGALGVTAFWATGSVVPGGWSLDLGSPSFPNPRYAAFLGLYLFIGLAATALLAGGLAGVAARYDPRRSIERLFSSSSDASWVIVASSLAFLVPVLIRTHVLLGMPLTDDEACYRFSAQLLASFRLYVSSPPMKLFFDRLFVINDGHFYTQYPLGWPLLMIPGLLVGLSGYMNAVYSALTIPALFLIVRRHLGSRWARVATILWNVAPMLAIGSATELAHTSCTMALAWGWFFALRSRDDPSGRSDALCALSLSLAFTIRPAVGLSMGAVILALWYRGLRSSPRGGRSRRVWSFALPAALAASLFLAVNVAQTGAPFRLAYQRAVQYAKENDYRFTGFKRKATSVRDLQFSSPVLALGRTTTALWRLNSALFGWPLSLMFLPLAGIRRGAGQGWATAGGFLTLHAFATHPGVDMFGPVHFYELSLPVVVLTAHGLRRAVAWARLIESRGGHERIRRHEVHGALRRLPAATVLALTTLSFACYLPVRLGALHRVVLDIRAPIQAVKTAGIRRAVIFFPRNYATFCRSRPGRHFVFWPPMNDPDLHNSVLWVNHITTNEDRQLMKLFPARTGYVLVWQRCSPVFVPLASPEAARLPDGIQWLPDQKSDGMPDERR